MPAHSRCVAALSAVTQIPMVLSAIAPAVCLSKTAANFIWRAAKFPPTHLMSAAVFAAIPLPLRSSLPAVRLKTIKSRASAAAFWRAEAARQPLKSAAMPKLSITFQPGLRIKTARLPLTFPNFRFPAIRRCAAVGKQPVTALPMRTLTSITMVPPCSALHLTVH